LQSINFKKRGDFKKMKKLIWAFVMATLMIGLIPAMLPVEASAQSYYVRKVRARNGRIRYVRVAKPSYYRRHRNRINVIAGTGGGALLGGLLGGRKGALIGAGVGAGSSALYTYKLNKKKRVYKKVRRY
jgi:outer membrane lipoprotein SlyB